MKCGFNIFICYLNFVLEFCIETIYFSVGIALPGCTGLAMTRPIIHPNNRFKIDFTGPSYFLTTITEVGV